jgi:hypothetical protein
MIKHIEDYLITLHPGTWFEWTDSKNKIYSNLKLSDKVSVAGEVVDNPFSLPTEEECTDGLAQLQSDYDAKEYSRNRAKEYPSIADQLDDIYHNGIDGWKETIKTTKDKYPK